MGSSERQSPRGIGQDGTRPVEDTWRRGSQAEPPEPGAVPQREGRGLVSGCSPGLGTRESVSGAWMERGLFLSFNLWYTVQKSRKGTLPPPLIKTTIDT